MVFCYTNILHLSCADSQNIIYSAEQKDYSNTASTEKYTVAVQNIIINLVIYVGSWW